ncbi:hypothetical protein UNPF46_04665 [Bradyrhizobium sp. UNPF46]|nr:hypothetical protein UNPF46_04665 [Bradyrhizobium sp. UNPF46]
MEPALHPARPAAAPGIRLLPLFLRNFARNRETGLVLVAIVVGLLSGALAAAIPSLSQVSHALTLDIPFDAPPQCHRRDLVAALQADDQPGLIMVL